MLKSILLAGAAMMTLPALAQTTGTTTTDTMTTGTAPPITEGVAAPNVRDDTAPNMAPGQIPTGDAADETDVVTNDPTVQTGQSGTMSDMGTTANTGVLNGGAVQRMSWNFAGDMGEWGSPDWGVVVMRTAYAPVPSAGMSGSAGTGASVGIGGPEDIDANWTSYAKSGAMLTPLEFGTWVLDAHGHDITRQMAGMEDGRSANNPRTQILNVTADALAAADMNGDWRVSREELAIFMGA